MDSTIARFGGSEVHWKPYSNSVALNGAVAGRPPPLPAAAMSQLIIVALDSARLGSTRLGPQLAGPTRRRLTHVGQIRVGRDASRAPQIRFSAARKGWPAACATSEPNSNPRMQISAPLWGLNEARPRRAKGPQPAGWPSSAGMLARGPGGAIFDSSGSRRGTRTTTCPSRHGDSRVLNGILAWNPEGEAPPTGLVRKLRNKQNAIKALESRAAII